MTKRRYSGSLIQFSHSRKSEVEELLVIDDRLREVEAALKHFLKMAPAQHSSTNERKSTISRSLYCFAAITYARCFSSGRRRTLKIDDFFTLSDGDRKLHEEIRQLRNQFFAHAVSADQEDAYLFLHASDGEGDPSGFVIAQVVMVGDNNETVREFLSLVEKVRSHLAVQIAEVGDQVAVACFGPGATWEKYAPKGSGRA